MYGLKLVVVAVAMLGMGAAAMPDVVGPCITASAVTTTVTVTACGQPTPPAVLPSEPNDHGTFPPPPPAETSWLSPAPAPAPAPSSPAQPVPDHSSSAPPSQGESSQAPPAPPASSASPASPASPVSSVGPSEEPHLPGHSSIATTTATESSPLQPTDSSPTKSDSPDFPHTGKPTPINAGSFKSVSFGMGSIVAAGMAFSAGITLLV